MGQGTANGTTKCKDFNRKHEFAGPTQPQQNAGVTNSKQAQLEGTTLAGEQQSARTPRPKGQKLRQCGTSTTVNLSSFKVFWNEIVSLFYFLLLQKFVDFLILFQSQFISNGTGYLQIFLTNFLSKFIFHSCN